MPTNSLSDLAALDRAAIETTVAVVDRWDPAADDPETPCAGWRMSDLVAHLTVQQRGFARAVLGERTDLPAWAPVKHDDPLDAHRAACAEALSAFTRAPERADVPVYLPEIRDDAVTVQTAVGFHLVDNVVHAWDAARALGVALDVDDAAVRAALDVAREVPDGARRDRPGASFAHRLPVPEGTSLLDETLLLLGRDPRWTPTSA